MQSNPPIFRSAISGSPSDTVAIGRLEGRSSAILHIDEETIGRARTVATFYGQQRVKVSVVVRFYDWLSEDHRELPPSVIEIPASSAISDSGAMYGA